MLTTPGFESVKRNAVPRLTALVAVGPRPTANRVRAMPTRPITGRVRSTTSVAPARGAAPIGGGATTPDPPPGGGGGGGGLRSHPGSVALAGTGSTRLTQPELCVT